MPGNGGAVAMLSGGVGGARLASGLAARLPAGDLTVIVNTADDFEAFGLRVCPDVDTVLYGLAGAGNPATGWGRGGDTGRVMAEIGRLGGPDWFFLGDLDLATHLLRTAWLRRGDTLSKVTDRLATAFGVDSSVVPMTDDRVRTVVATDLGEMAFQDWFAKLRCDPPALSVRFDGARDAGGAPGAVRALMEAAVVVIGPSNPLLSIDPILAVADLHNALAATPAPVVAVSPLVGGRALKGPADRMMADLAEGASSAGIARHYRSFLDGLVIDERDAGDADNVEDLGIACLVTDTIMGNSAAKARLAQAVLAFGARLAPEP